MPTEDELGVANIRKAGGVVLGKTNTPEFGAGANTRNRVYGATGNPFDPEKTFDEGATAARQIFEEYVDAQMEAYKEERYGGWFGWRSRGHAAAILGCGCALALLA